MMTVRDYVAVGVVLLFLGLAVQPMVGGELPDLESPAKGQTRGRDEVPAPFRNLAELASNLLNATTDKTDTDQDGLPDNVERALGTTPDKNDSDLDRLDDNYEVFHGLDPNKPDSNGDGMPDLIEETGVSSDLDSDGVPNAWDWDNDNDGVMDEMDYSPFAMTSPAKSFHIDINLSGKPTFITFQFRTRDPAHLRLIMQSWNWPFDEKGNILDLDSSTDDLRVYPVLEFRADGLPDTEAVASQGITVSGGAATLPVLPISELGNIVALKARMFYPESPSQRNISADISFCWKVIGKTDKVVKALWLTQYNKYLSADAGGNLSASSSSVGESEVFEWIMPVNGTLALRASNGNYLAMGADGRLAASQNRSSDSATFNVTQYGSILKLKASNGRYVRLKPNGSFMADADRYSDGTFFEQRAQPFRFDLVPMVTYGEDFLLTGCQVEEDFGTTAGVVYGGNQSLMLAANVAMDCDFLRNATLGLDKVPDHLKGTYNISVGSNITGFYTYEEALCALAGPMPKDALNRLPNGTCLPIISAIEDSMRSVDLAGMSSGGYLKGNRLVANCTAMEVITTRTLKTTWYNTTSDRPMEFWEAASDIAGWNTTLASKTAIIILAAIWAAGVQRVVRIGTVSVDFSSELKNASINLNKIERMQVILDTFGELLELLDKFVIMPEALMKAYVANAKIILTSRQIIINMPMDAMNCLVKKIGQEQKAIAKAFKWVGFAEKAGTCLEIIGFLLDLVLIGFTVYALVDSFGGSATGVIVASLIGTLMLAYSTTLLGLAIAGGPIGAAIAALIGLIDWVISLIFGSSGSQMLINLVVKLFVKLFMDVKVRTKVALEPISTATAINDSDGNGLDVGDNITYTGQFFGNVTLTDSGKADDLKDSYIQPRFRISVPYIPLTRWSEWSRTYSYSKVVSTSSSKLQKTTVYETGASVIPASPMVNFPVVVTLATDYKIYYENTWFWSIHDRKSTSNSTSSGWTTLDFDIMPASIDDFMRWRSVASNDYDGDGLNNSLENGTKNGTSAWKWDTDSDRLGDEYELALGSDPAKADTDGDGLNDSLELKLRTNVSSNDTDRDGLSDYAEVSGAVTSFDFCGARMHYLTNSDPLMNDTDGDGVADPMEYRCLLNPRSQDTNGDGFRDMLGDYGSEKITLDRTIATPFNGFTKILVMSPDRHLWAFQAKSSAPVNFSIVKYDANGTIEGIWTADQNVSDMAFDGRGFLYVLHRNPTEIIKYDSSYNKIGSWSAPVCNTIAIDSSSGILYITGYYCVTLYKYYLNNMTFMGTMKGPDYYGWHLMRMDVDGDGNLYIPYNSSIYVFARNGTLIQRFGKWGQTNGGEFSQPSAVRKCSDGDIVVADTYNERLQKFSTYGNWRLSYGPKTDMMASDYFEMPDTVAIDDNYLYIRGGGPLNGNNIMKLRYSTDVAKVNQTTNFTDADGDGMSDKDELLGWNVTISSNSSGRAPVTYHVTSDPNQADTDGDGLSDLDERRSSADARRVDTDADGLSDRAESGLATNLTDWDTDGDRLDDGTEPTFGSDPRRNDTDGEGLDDLAEFLEGSDPTAVDSDGDGLDDRNESLFGSDPTDPDSDDDAMFDASEKENGTDPNIGDTDGDGLIDGYEPLYGTDPKSNDTDGDGLADGLEIVEGLDPLCNDTDGDGLADGYEVAAGMDPFSPDSDGDGVPDSLDTDSAIALDDDIILVADGEDGLEAFWSSLSKEATVVNATPEELVGKYGGEPYIVLVGRPDAPNGTAGALMGGLLEGSGETPDQTWEHIAVRYGVWAPTQTVVMLSGIAPYDALQVLGILKSLKLTVTPDRLTARYLNPRSDFQLTGIDAVRATGSAVLGRLEDPAMFNVTVSRYNASNAPADLTYGTGLEPGDLPLGRYLDISLDGGGRAGSGRLNRTLLGLYYTAADLDRNGDGDADDSGDINESSLALYALGGPGGNWSKLRAGQDGVDGLELNTTDFELYGRQYQGVIWLNLTRLALLGVGGRANGGNLPVSARAGDDVTVYVGDEAVFNGTLSTGNGAIANFTWTFRYENRTVTLFGPVASFVFQAPGNYTVTLAVTDSLGLSASDSLNVAVVERPSGKWILRVGPVTDDNGTALAGALVNLSIGGSILSNTTDGLGMALFELLPGDIGKGARLFISKEGFLPVEYATNITAARELERNPPSLVRIRPDENFTLETGPVKDAKGNAIEGALVTLTVDGKTYSNNTDAQGNARFVLPLSVVGKNIGVSIEKEGYSPVSFDTRISVDRKLDQNPPAMQKVARPSPQGANPPWAIAAAAIAIVIVVLLAAVLMRRKRPAAAGDEPEGGGKESEEPEAPKEGPPPVPPIVKAGGERAGGAAIPEVAEPEPAAKEAVGEMRKTGGA